MIGFEMDEMVSESLLNGFLIMHAEEKERINLHLWNDEREFTMLKNQVFKKQVGFENPAVLFITCFYLLMV